MPSDETTPAERQALIDSAILSLLINEDSHRPWSVQEVEREVQQNATDSLGRLYGGGLIHRLPDGVFEPAAVA
jgi:hypothetical protein